MNTRDDFSDEQLQAFVDNEINTSDRARILELAQKDDALACRICELMQIKDMVRLAYREPPQSGYTQSRWNASHVARLSARSVAAMLLLGIGTWFGWTMHPPAPNGAVTAPLGLAQMDPARTEMKRVVLHISTADAGRLEEALDSAEELLSTYRKASEKVQLEIVANTAGLTLLRMDTSPFVERIRRMAMEYENLSFLACSRTIEKLRLQGIDVHLVPEATVIPGALEEIVTRLQQGWAYIRV